MYYNVEIQVRDFPADINYKDVESFEAFFNGEVSSSSYKNGLKIFFISREFVGNTYEFKEEVQQQINTDFGCNHGAIILTPYVDSVSYHF